MSRAQSWVCIPLPHCSFGSLSVCDRRHRSFLQRVDGGVDRCSIALHRFLPKKRRRIQQRVQECQTWSHCCRYRLCMDVGRHSGSFISPTFTLSPPLARIWCLLVPHCSCNQALWLTNTVSPVRGGMVLARQSKFCFSPRSGPRFLIERNTETNLNSR
jgi:hypothetical protein